MILVFVSTWLLFTSEEVGLLFDQKSETLLGLSSQG